MRDCSRGLTGDDGPGEEGCTDLRRRYRLCREVSIFDRARGDVTGEGNLRSFLEGRIVVANVVTSRWIHETEGLADKCSQATPLSAPTNQALRLEVEVVGVSFSSIADLHGVFTNDLPIVRVAGLTELLEEERAVPQRKELQL